MTTLDARPSLDAAPPQFSLAEPRLLRAHAYDVPARTQEWLVQAAGSVHLLGRGGAAFPVATKLAAVPAGACVLVNGSEGEPASWKDRVLMRHHPELVVAGTALVASALRSPRSVIAVTDHPSHSALLTVVRRLGARIEVRHVDHGFVGGEIGALVNGLDGHRPVPDGVKVMPHVRGLRGRPTYASNVETFAQLALLASLGPAAYAATGSASEPGTSLVTVHDVDRVGVIEVPNGVELSRLVGERDRPVLVGGYHGTWTVAGHLVVDRLRLREQGVGWGAGVLAVLPDDTCPLGEVARVAHWLAAQSARQCGPCAFGLPAIAEDLHALAGGVTVDPDRLQSRILQTSGRGACHHPTGATGFVASALTAFAADVRRHLARGHCGRPVLDALPIGGAL